MKHSARCTNQMVRIRLFEEAIQKAYFEGKSPAFDIAAGPIPGEMHLAAGQEPRSWSSLTRRRGDRAC
jgi:TPP-dependent pyruvate/acetoin dehydrogenase alpha subunit